jgi:calcineurin-like phosphoesterase family protein
MSDLHLESTRGWDLPAVADRPDFDVLVIAGDLIPRAERGVAWILERVDRPAVFVCGNHESYGCDIDRTVEKARALAAGTNVHVLQNDTVQIGDVTFIGATFWTDFNLFGDPGRAMVAAAEIMNDYRKIRVGRYVYRLRPHHTLQRHRQSREFIANELRKPKVGCRVVVTHMAPHPSAIRPAFDEEITSAAYSRLGLSPITLTAADIEREPRFTNSRLVWSYRMHPVGISLRMRVLQILGDDAPMSLSRLLSAVRGDRDPSPAVMALACSDLIELDLVSRPIGPSTIVRSRS